MADGLDGLRKAVRGQRSQLVAPSDGELSRRFTELTNIKTNLEKKIGNHLDQVERTREKLKVEECSMRDRERDLEEVRRQLVGTKVMGWTRKELEKRRGVERTRIRLEG